MRLFKAWGPVSVWMGCIFLFSTRQSIAVSPESTVNFMLFKTLHVIEYAILFLLTIRALRMTFKDKNKERYRWTALAITALYALTDEIHQIYVPTREGTIRDVIIDIIGGLCTWIFLLRVLPKMPKKLKYLARKLQIG